MMPPERITDAFFRATQGADVAVVEGVMGLFDGAGDGTDAGATADLAKRLGLPVVLVVDTSKMAGSVAAIVHGYATLDADVTVAGVILNRVAGARHLEHLSEAINRRTNVPVLGTLYRDGELTLAERHLGLTTAEDLADHALLDRIADAVTAGVDLERLLALAAPISGVSSSEPWPEPTVRLGVARDAAFCFAYPDNLDALARAGAEIVPFSPLTEIELPEGLDGLYLPGGYPELYAGALSENRSMRSAIHAAAASGMPIVAECGGLIYLSEGIHVTDGGFHPFCGVLPARCRMHEKRAALGYRRVMATQDGPFGAMGTELRGHEFRYSGVDDDALARAGVKRALSLSDRLGKKAAGEGYRVHNTWASYAHVMLTPDAAANWVRFLADHRR